MRERLRQEDGIALLLALGFSVALSLLVFGMTSYVTSNQHDAQNSSADGVARSYAEAALNVAYSRLVWANQTAQIWNGYNPSQPALLGCAAGSLGASDCSGTISRLCAAFTKACPSGTYTPTVGTGAVYGFYTGTVTGSHAGVSAAASTWILVATGFARNGSGLVDSKTLRATVTISPGGSGSVASVWNHIFLTAPLVANTCQANFTGNSTVLDMPMYVVGNLCFGGNGIALKEVAGGQAVDLQVGGKLILSGQNSSVGDYSTNPATAITSGAVAGGCNASGVANATTSCTSGSYLYKVTNSTTFVSQNDPSLTDAQAMSKYSTFDPGPKHPCASGTTPSPLSANQLDFSIASGEGTTALPDNTGSGSSGGVFNLTPTTSYACISTSGTSTGYLIWNADASNSLTVSGITVPAKTLAINGSIFIDAPLQISQTMTYKGTGIIMASGQISLPTSNMQVCAQNTSCLSTNWQGSTSNTDMLSLATILKNSNQAIYVGGNNVTIMASLWAPPSSQLWYNGNSPITVGPLSVGSMTIISNTFTFKPLPVITNMPVGAPVPPNVSAQIGPLNIIG